MMSESEFLPPDMPEAFSEILQAERRDVLALAGKYHEAAHRLRGAGTNFVGDLFVVTEDVEFPPAGEKIRIEPRNTRTAPISEVFLYMSLDDVHKSHALPSLVLIDITFKSGGKKKVMVSEQQVFVFDDEQTLDIDEELVKLATEDVEPPSLGADNITNEKEYTFLKELQDLLRDRKRYQLGRQPRPSSE